ncbi:hypothetical protein MKX83_24125 [Cytobacillus sp. FSL M8-0252]|uniref:hypothetical protein n=1 Tax=Cytobacillus sp. FSL M8-0252 TaxID=2921621 RepID=UPI0030F4EF69
MIIGKVFKGHTLIFEGIATGGKKFSKINPEQYINLTIDTETNEEETFMHNDEENVFFKEYQDNGKGWEEVYDSRERIDRTVEYDLPSWFISENSIPDYHHKYEDGHIKTTFKGYYN